LTLDLSREKKKTDISMADIAQNFTARPTITIAQASRVFPQNLGENEGSAGSMVSGCVLRICPTAP